MAQWQRMLNIKQEWEDAKRNAITIQQLAQIISDKLSKIPDFKDEDINDQRDDLACDFQRFSEGESADKNEFDDLMEHLYDWADTPIDDKFNGKKTCWVKTM